MKPRVAKENAFHSFRHLPVPTPLRILEDTDFIYQIHTTQLNPFISWHQNVKKTRYSIWLLWTWEEAGQIWLQTGVRLSSAEMPSTGNLPPNCQAGQLRQPGWKQQSSSRVWSPFGHQWNQWPWPKERAPGLAESASSYAHPNTCFGATSAPESVPFESVMKCCDSCSQQQNVHTKST